MKRLAIAATFVAALFVPTLAGEVPTVGVATPPPPPTQTANTNTNASLATTILLTLLNLGLVRR